MDTFTFLVIYFIVFSILSGVVYAAFLLLQRYADRIHRSTQSKIVILALLLATSLTFSWFAVSSTMVLYVKWVMTRWQGGAFTFPLLTTTIHMAVKLMVTRVWLWATPSEPRPTDTWRTYATLVVPIGVTTVADVAFSNQALIYLTVGLYTTIKSSTLVFVYAFGVALGLETFRWRTCACVLTLAAGVGVAVMTAAATQLSVLGNGTCCCCCARCVALWKGALTSSPPCAGVTLCLGAAVAGGLRWALVHYLVQRDRAANHVLAVLYKISPVAVVALLPVAVGIEGARAMRSPLLDGAGGWSLPIEALFLSLVVRHVVHHKNHVHVAPPPRCHNVVCVSPPPGRVAGHGPHLLGDHAAQRHQQPDLQRHRPSEGDPADRHGHGGLQRKPLGAVRRRHRREHRCGRRVPSHQGRYPCPSCL
jgi:hypothetical protein